MVEESPNEPLPETKPLFDSMLTAEKRIEKEDDLERKRTRSYIADGNTSHLPYSDCAFGDMKPVRTTIVRSYAQWSAGLSETEEGIHEAYKRLIADSEHCLYIENQFFVSACGENDNIISNTVVNR